RELRLRELGRGRAHGSGIGGLRLGALDSVFAVDHRPVLVDRSLLRTVSLCMHEAPGTLYPREASRVRACRGGGVFPAVSAAFHVRARGNGWRLRLDVR